MPLGIYFLHAGRRTGVRLFAAAGLVVLTLGFVWSGSRGGFIALVGGGRLRRRPVLGDSRSGGGCPRRRSSPIVLLATASDQYWEQMGTITSDADYNHTIGERAACRSGVAASAT